MPRHIVLLTEPAEVEFLLRVVRAVDRTIPVSVVTTKAELIACPALKAPGARLVAFCSSTVVPRAVLDGLDGPAYNFHPGPPEIPGLFPSVWAIYHGHRRFGVTAHVMYPKVDTGPIVAVERYDLEDGVSRLNVDIMAREAVYRLFGDAAAALTTSDVPLAHRDIQWSGRCFTRRDFNALCRITPDIAKEEFDLRLRALGEGPEHALTVHLHGRDFAIAPLDPSAPVVRGGVPIDAEKDRDS